MQLVTTQLEDRAFALQFFTIVREFGRVIPWLSRVTPLTYYTNPTHFRDQFLRRLGCTDPSDIIPYQFTRTDEGQEYVGGLLHFRQAPESFKDQKNRALLERLNAEQFRFITCLQVRGVHRRAGYGRQIMERGLTSILRVHGKVWGVVSEPHLLSWYQSMGAKMLSPRDNRDSLWLISWESTPTCSHSK